MNSSGYWDLDKDIFVEAEFTDERPSFDSVVGKGEDAYHQVHYDSDGLGIEHHQWIFPPMQDWGHVNDPHSRGFYVHGIQEPVVMEWQDHGPMGSFPDYVGLHTGTSYALLDLRYRRLVEYKRQKPYWQTPEGKREANFWSSTVGRAYAITKEQEGTSVPAYHTWARDFGERVLNRPEDVQAEKGRNQSADRLVKLSVIMPLLTLLCFAVVAVKAPEAATEGVPMGWITVSLLMVVATIVTWLMTAASAVKLMGGRSQKNVKETVKWTGAGIGWGLIIKRLFF